MDEQGVTYRQLAAQTGLSAGYLNHLVHGNRPVPSNDVVKTLAGALEVEPEHFREFRLRAITERLEAMPELIDRLYKRLEASSRVLRTRSLSSGTARLEGHVRLSRALAVQARPVEAPALNGQCRARRDQRPLVFCGSFPTAWTPLASKSHRKWLVVLHGWVLTPFTCLG